MNSSSDVSITHLSPSHCLDLLPRALKIQDSFSPSFTFSYRNLHVSKLSPSFRDIEMSHNFERQEMLARLGVETVPALHAESEEQSSDDEWEIPYMSDPPIKTVPVRISEPRRHLSRG